MRKHAWPIISLFVLTLFLFLPILVNPQIFLARDNDLTNFFWPIYYFSKKSIIEHHQIPLWFPNVLSGTPLLPDPQSPIFYLPNILFLILPINIAFIVSSLLHTFIGSLGTYLAARKGFGFEKLTSFFAAAFYLASPRLAGFIEAGHFGLIMASAWLPWVVWAIKSLSHKPKFIWTFLLGFSLAAIFFTHPTTFVWVSIFSVVFFIILTVKKAKFLKKSAFFGLGAVLTFGLTAISFLPQLEWVPQTTRYLLTTDREVWPKWASVFEFLKAIFIPNPNQDTEKWLVLGIGLTVLAIVSFLKLKIKHKLIILIVTSGVLVLAANNVSPFYEILLDQDWFVFGRVTTRIWFVVVLLTTFLAAYAIQNIKPKGLKIIFPALVIVELVFSSWLKITKPISVNNKYISEDIYSIFQNDTEKYRVYCTNRCIPQFQAVKRNLELIEGYSTLTQKNYYTRAFALTGTFWDYYSLSTPPIGAYTFELPQPDAIALGEQNTKYVISPYQLTDKNLILIKSTDMYFVYLNNAFQPRSNGKITLYSPNRIIIETQEVNSNSLWVSEVYSPGWVAYLNGKEKTVVEETPIHLRSVNIGSDTNFIEFRYEPESYLIGRIITYTTIFFLVLWSIWRYLSRH